MRSWPCTLIAAIALAAVAAPPVRAQASADNAELVARRWQLETELQSIAR